MNEVNQTKKNVANEILLIFKTLKKSIFLALIFFVGFSVYNDLISYSFFDKSFAWFEAEEILGYKPSQYNFVPSENQEKDMFDPVYGFMEISEEGKKEVKSDIIKQLLEDSLIYSLIMIPIFFIILLLFNYLKRSVNWVKKHAE